MRRLITGGAGNPPSAAPVAAVNALGAESTPACCVNKLICLLICNAGDSGEDKDARRCGGGSPVCLITSLGLGASAPFAWRDTPDNEV